MRLINTRTHRLEEFIGQNIPPYAILSHTWEDDEVSYQQYCALLADMGPSEYTSSFTALLRKVRQRESLINQDQRADRIDLSAYNDVKGIRKIERTCRLALAAGLDYAWIDTCCINQSSSAELTEAINSMYRWYQRATVCFAYLSEFPSRATLCSGAGAEASSDMDAEWVPRPKDNPTFIDCLRRCRWFTRGWTLQELIAPESLYFYNAEWEEIGSKASLLTSLTAITRIPKDVLAGDRKLFSICVAQKMSWAARRTTTRTEDLAYCLLGIFDVNMPLLYGEEEKSFRRLQEEILKSSTDMSIFAWESTSPSNANLAIDLQDRSFSGIMAYSPLQFESCTDTERIPSHKPLDVSISSNGVKMRIPKSLHAKAGGLRYVLPLYCRSRGKLCGIEMRKCGSDVFIRANPWRLEEYRDQDMRRSNSSRTFLMLTTLPEVGTLCGPDANDIRLLIGLTRTHGLQFAINHEIDMGYVWPPERFDHEDQMFFVFGDPNWDYCSLNFQVNVSKRLVFDCDFLAVGWSNSSRQDIQCSIVDHQAHGGALRYVRSQMESDPPREWFLGSLSKSGIPVCSSVVYSIPETSLCAKISFRLSPVHDARLCSNKFWNVSFDTEIGPSTDIHQDHSLQWNQESVEET
ncbi:heterokaryon incompatibility protein-domain-containing protein [Lophiotrema nucula]|uniref:Heterokaryon incompatibility protein-domain-containing protein n=1 Tax=Lophiotrema nucula TaxID=690887 RepID=A0A6A5ZBG0_9PLEO|nr:heterokaryon incompatibility protein-domain-containing protein [Lophiotrema nucula]